MGRPPGRSARLHDTFPQWNRVCQRQYLLHIQQLEAAIAITIKFTMLHSDFLDNDRLLLPRRDGLDGDLQAQNFDGALQLSDQA